MPPIDHECSLLGVVAELSNQLEKVKHELAQLKSKSSGCHVVTSAMRP